MKSQLNPPVICLMTRNQKLKNQAILQGRLRNQQQYRKMGCMQRYNKDFSSLNIEVSSANIQVQLLNIPKMARG